MLFHGKSIAGCFVFIPPWMEIIECAMSPSVDVEGVNRAFAYIEEYWLYEPRSNDVLCR